MTLDKEIPATQYFKVQGGPVLPSPLALRAYLRTIPQQQFDAHVGAEKNDFADWIDHVFGETVLAQRLRACTARERMVWELDDAFAEIRMAAVIAEKTVERKASPKVEGAPDFSEPVELEEDGRFDPHKGGIMETNEKMIAKYDDVIRKMQAVMKDPMPEELEKRSEQLRARYQEIMGKISELRKKGRDALIPALVIRQFMPKLKLAEATRETKDYDVASAALDNAEAEFKEAEDAKDVDVKKEVMALVEAQERQVPDKEAKAQA
jgi:hypothetical protein